MIKKTLQSNERHIKLLLCSKGIGSRMHCSEIVRIKLQDRPNR